MSEVEELQAEVERLRAHEVANGCIPRPVYEHLAKVAREHADALDRVEALADDEFATDDTADLPDEGVVFEQGAMWAFAEAGRLTSAALAVPVTGDTEDASPAAEDTTEDCGRRVGSKPWWMGSDQYDPCHCLLPKGHDGECKCSHTLEDAGAASPTEQATEGGAK